MEKLLITLSIVLCTLVSCEKAEVKKMKENKSYTSLEIDGVSYKSTVMNDWSFRVSSQEHLLDRQEDSFHFEIKQTLTDEKGEKITLNLRIKELESLELNKEYTFPSYLSAIKFHKTGKVTITDGDLERYYYATDGSLKIESVVHLNEADDRTPFVVNGSFQFTAQEEFTGDVINVSNGTFNRTFFMRKNSGYSSNWKN